jgi:hypothetical protein
MSSSPKVHLIFAGRHELVLVFVGGGTLSKLVVSQPIELFGILVYGGVPRNSLGRGEQHCSYLEQCSVGKRDGLDDLSLE